MASIDYNGPGPPKGFLVPPWYQEQKPSLEEMNIISIIWGFSLACAGFTFVKAVRQTWCCLYRWHRRRRHEQQRQQEQEQVHGQESRGQLRRVTSKRSSTGQSYYTRPTRVLILNGYLAMVWAEWLVSVAFGILSWFYLNPNLVVRGSFWVFFGFLCLWTVQMQCILQILVNRVSLLLLTGSDRRCASRLKWGVAAFVGVINVSCFVVWIPARLQISPEWIKANKIWDRTEKAFFAIADIALNLLFLYLVRTKLIGNGLQKYRRLFWTNSVAVFFSVSLDVILIGVMSLQDDAVYLQFHPLVYLLKLHIEMNLAELLAKIVRASNKLNDCDSGGTNSGGSGAWASGQQMKQAVAIDFDIYSDRSNTTADGGGSVLGPCTTSGTTGSALPSYPPGVRRTNSNSHNNHGLDMELDLNIAPDECYDDRCGIHRLSRSWGKGSTEEDRSIMNEARRLGVGTNMDTNLRGGGRPSVERHSSSSVLMKVSSEDS
ncbi:epoxide hydrolase [Apiospora kogelbergensis]|uniref:Epoxide hydrolase n=1 Tax=Apiospora kogelbergensis TaxID=1337665 RepID=A0AAW0Q9U2_9PEZI